MSHRILLVDDEIDILEFVRYNLQKEGYEVFTAQNGAEALKAAAKYRPHLILLDMMMPVMDGAQTCRAIRQDPQLRDTMVVFLSALGEEDQQLTGFGVGADDYLTKPFSVDELLARVRANLRRSSMASSESTEASTFDNGPLHIDYAAGYATKDGRELSLTPTEYKLLVLLAKNIDKVLTHTFITREIWGTSWDSDLASLRVFMRTLRKKIEADPSHPKMIQTHMGVGYRMQRL